MAGLSIDTNIIDNKESWNKNVHQLIQLIDLEDKFPPWVSPKCYPANKSCGHVLKVDIQDVATKTLHLTMFEKTSDIVTLPQSVNIAALFIHLVLFHNPLWDIGLQHQIVKQNVEKVYNTDQ